MNTPASIPVANRHGERPPVPLAIHRERAAAIALFCRILGLPWDAAVEAAKAAVYHSGCAGGDLIDCEGEAAWAISRSSDQ